jgi:hypothetical protein
MSKFQYLSSKQKCALLKSYNVIPKISLRDAAAHLNVSHRTLNTFFAYFSFFFFFQSTNQTNRLLETIG